MAVVPRLGERDGQRAVQHAQGLQRRQRGLAGAERHVALVGDGDASDDGLPGGRGDRDAIGNQVEAMALLHHDDRGRVLVTEAHPRLVLAGGREAIDADVGRHARALERADPPRGPYFQIREQIRRQVRRRSFRRLPGRAGAAPVIGREAGRPQGHRPDADALVGAVVHAHRPVDERRTAAEEERAGAQAARSRRLRCSVHGRGPPSSRYLTRTARCGAACSPRRSPCSHRKRRS